MTPLAASDGPVRSIRTVVDDASGSASGDLLLRIETDGRAPLVFVDVDGDRLSGGWTYQTHVSDSAWNLHVDAEGRLWGHHGNSDAWSWRELGVVPGYDWEFDGEVAHLCLPGRLLADLGGTAGQVAVAAEIDDHWLPIPFVAGVRATRPVDTLPVVPVRAPQRLAFAYQFAPWEVEGCAALDDDLDCAVRHHGRFAHVVFAAGLQEPEHPSHEGTRLLLERLRDDHPDQERWGYVSLLRHSGTWYDNDEVERLAALWQELGVTGIFVDEFDLCEPGWRHCRRDGDREVLVSRDRQRDAVRRIHDLGLAVFANSHSIHGALGDVRGEPTPLGDGDGVRPPDMYLLENPTVWAGNWWRGLDRLAAIARFHDAPRYMARTGVRLAVVDTAPGRASDAPPGLFEASWWRAVLAGADAHAFTNPVYSASGDVADDLSVFDPPAIAGLPAGLDAAGLRYVGGVEVARDGDDSWRLVADCEGRAVGRVHVHTAADGRVTGGLEVEETPSTC